MVIAYDPGCLQTLCDLAYERYPETCRRKDNCEGQQFADRYNHTDVEALLPEAVAYWSIENLGDAMDGRLRQAFIAAASRTDAGRLGMFMSESLTDQEATALVTDKWDIKLNSILRERSRSLALSLLESKRYDKLTASAKIVVAAVIEAQQSQTNPGVKGREYDDLRTVRRT